MFAQAVADREGPRVDVHAIITQASSSRRVRAAFNVEDDSYVLIGQVDGSGTVRIIFPTDPRDDGFVKGGKRYETSDVFAGFSDQYRYRFNYARYYQHGLNSDAYDGALGYMFIVASWRPMHFDRFATDGVWDSYEIADEESLRDPKPAIYELAALLVGENREAYTVKFARYYNTTDISPGFGNAYSALGYGAGLCNGLGYGYQTFGWSDIMFPGLNSAYEYDIANGLDFTYRGINYFYDPAGDCYYRSAAFSGGRFGLPVVPINPNKPRMIAATDTHRPPVSPRKPPKLGPLAAQAQDVNAATQLPRTSPTYRQRGLLTDDENPGAGRREPRPAALDGGRTRPAIQQMVSHRLQDGNDGNEGWARAATRGQANDIGNRAWSRPTSAGEQGGYNPPRMRTENAGQSTNRGENGGRYPNSGRTSADSPRSAPPPRSEPSSSSSSAGRVSAPSSSSGASHPSAPASSSGSSGSVKPPV